MNKPSALDRILTAFATLGPVGYLPIAPGTWGSAAAVLAAPFVFVSLDTGWRILVLAVVLVVGCVAATRAEKVLDKKDPGPVVLDEVLGQWATLMPVMSPTIVKWPELWEYAAAFFLFRFFDILKPFPVRQLERVVPGGTGVMIDDLAAGVYAGLCLWGLQELAPMVLG